MEGLSRAPDLALEILILHLFFFFVIGALKRLWRVYRLNRRHKTHPRIIRSSIDNLEVIDPTASICDSSITGKVSIGNGCVLERCNINAISPVSIGRSSILSGPVRIVADLHQVEVGKFCSIAPHVDIRESLHNHHRMTTYAICNVFFKDDFRLDLASKGPVRIGNDVWIGTRAVILSGVTIGDGVVIGAGSVVVKSLPPYTICAGVPARPLKPRFPAELARQIQELKWWDWDTETILRNRSFWRREVTAEMLAEVRKEVGK